MKYRSTVQHIWQICRSAILTTLKTNTLPMKKLVLFLFVGILSSTFSFAQDTENNLKNFRFGLKIMPALTWFKPDDTKKFENDGLRAKFGYGLSTEFRLNRVASIATGVQIDYDGGRIRLKDTAYYFLDADDALIERDGGDGTGFSGNNRYELRKRSYNTTYVTIPLTLKLKSNEVGQFIYYGQFGVNASIRTRGRVDDDVRTSSSSAEVSQSKLLNTKDMQLFKLALNVGIGAEYNLSGSTSFTVGVNYINGFTNVVKGESRYLIRTPFNNYANLKQDFRANAVVLSIGVLF